MSLTRDLARLNIDSAGAFSPFSVNRLTSDGEIISLKKDGTQVGGIGATGGDLTIGTGDTRVRFIDSLDCVLPVGDAAGTSRDAGVDLGHSETRFKDIYTSGGIYLGAASNASPVAANYLDDYEEGTWTPVMKSGSTTVTIASAAGIYVKTGKMVLVQGSFQRNDSTFHNQIVGIQGLPYARDTVSYLTPVGAGWGWLDLGTGADQTMLPYHASNQIQFVFDTRVVNTRYLYANSFTNSRYFYFCSTYRTTA